MLIPAEWKPHRATWLAWPDLVEEWKENHEGARREFLAFARAIVVEGANPQEKLKILVKSEAEKKKLSDELSKFTNSFELHIFEYGDIWLRDTGCLFSEHAQEAHVFTFNGWGGKYKLGRDHELAASMAEWAGAKKILNKMVFEGGAIDHNGEGLWLTTRECLLNPNRNSSMTEADYNNVFKSLGAKDVCWINVGLKNDHTDGHVDNIARFVSEKTILCMDPAGKDDPQFERLTQIKAELQSWASRHSLEVLSVKGPGLVEAPWGEFMPASYMNFYIANNSVAVPVYGSSNDAAAVELISKIFKNRKVLPLASNNILTGGGSFHCISQQEPL